LSAIDLEPQRATKDEIRATDRLANERTFLAWIRTSLALITFGFVIAKFSVWLRQLAVAAGGLEATVSPPRPGLSLPAGVTLMAFGALVAALAVRRQRAVDAALAEGRFPDARRLSLLVAMVIIVVALALIAFLLASSL
jgi:putative membrane protein